MKCKKCKCNLSKATETHSVQKKTFLGLKNGFIIV